ncbi:alpha-galactosidase [Athalassotoga saccharophila]|uniref:alpha-galactosidase n=1 Tax=Athalassotoga saccharophila TaxID=1441386 RepID=UPI001E586CD4|nr:alpha-galactosidase [Athalassotoga saccharophila]BBJ28189.1 bifunctional alpha-galactosidase/sucrose kinase AgaSK [Athalassotoga saccharophila]
MKTLKTYKISSGNFQLLMDNNFGFEIFDTYSKRWITLKGSADYLLKADGEKIDKFSLEKVKVLNGKNGLGLYKKYIFEGISETKNSQMKKYVYITVFSDFKDAFLIKVKYLIGQKIDIENVVRNEIKIGNSKMFWAFQGASYPERPDWILPVTQNYHRENYMGMNSNDYGGGIPIVDVWSKDGGVAIGILEKKPHPVSIPLVSDKEGIHLKILENRKVILNGEYEGYSTVLLPHRGDFFDPLERYSKILTKLGLIVRKNKYPKDAYLPQWCAWGYGRDFSYDGQYMEDILKTIGKVKELGFGWVVIDDGWQDKYGDWGISKLAFGNGEDDLIETVKKIHEKHLKAGIWFIPLAASKDSELLKVHKELMVLDKDSHPIEIDFWNSYYLCPSMAGTKKVTTDLVKRLISNYDFDGLKVDGQHINAVPPCFNNSHDHKSEFESYESSPKLIKKIYDLSHSIKKDAVIEICPCGSCASIYNMPSCDLPVASDPKSSFQIRHRGKAFKALMGRNVPYFGDYVELTETGKDFASTIGIGGVPGSMFTLNGSGHYPLTKQREKNIKKWIDIYNKLRLSEGEYLNLYDMVFDHPETHVVRKGKRLYYSIFASKFSGQLELRGLKKSKEYEIFNCENDYKIATLKKGERFVNLDFKDHILICAIPKQVADYVA